MNKKILIFNYLSSSIFVGIICYLYLYKVFIHPANDLFNNYYFYGKWYLGYIQWGLSLFITLAFFVFFLNRPGKYFLSLIILCFIYEFIFIENNIKIEKLDNLYILVTIIQLIVLCVTIIGSIHFISHFRKIQFIHDIMRFSKDPATGIVKRCRFIIAFVFALSYTSSSLWDGWFYWYDSQWDDISKGECISYYHYFINKAGLIAAVHINDCELFSWENPVTYIYVFPKDGKESRYNLVYRYSDGNFNNSIEWINNNTILLKVNGPSDFIPKKFSNNKIYVKIIDNQEYSPMHSSKDSPS